MVAEKRRCGYGMRNFCNSASKLQKNVENRCFFPKFVTFVESCRVNKQVQNYFKSLKNSTKGEEKIRFFTRPPVDFDLHYIKWPLVNGSKINAFWKILSETLGSGAQWRVFGRQEWRLWGKKVVVLLNNR